MKTHQLSNGDLIPLLGLGTWKMDDETAEQAVESAIDIGYRHIDGAWIYLNETGVGRGLKNAFDSGIVQREDVWVTSKLWNDCHRPEHVRPAIERTLNALQLDYLDLYLIHWPVAHQHGIERPEEGHQFVSLEEVPLTATWQAMRELLDTGLTRHVGVSNFSIKKLQELESVTQSRPSVNQVECHPLHQQSALKSYCDENEILLTAYAPLGSGDRPERLIKESEPGLMELETIKSIAEAHQTKPAQILLAWALQRGTAAIPKSASRSHQLENFAANDLTLSDAEMDAIGLLDKGYRFFDGTFWEMPGGPYTVSSLWDEPTR